MEDWQIRHNELVDQLTRGEITEDEFFRLLETDCGIHPDNDEESSNA